MSVFFIILHVLVCLALIMIVLLQTGKGASMGAAFGSGASQTVFGSQGAGGFLSKITAAAAIIFMLTSLSLSYISDRQIGGGSVMEEVTVPAQEQPAAPTPQPAPETSSPAVPDMPKEQAQPIQPGQGDKP